MKLDPQQIAILQSHNQMNSGVIFTAEDLRDLQQGTATLKVNHEASKVLTRHKEFMEEKVSRGEVNTFFVSTPVFQRFMQTQHIPFTVLLDTIVGLLTDKGIISDAEIMERLKERKPESVPGTPA